ncbi:MAG: terpene cyclase/mutase family protein [Thermoplasmata archaeon]|nr:MAG: terpene cyclase/mutase family protein [Thermoplasmata archaeon]
MRRYLVALACAMLLAGGLSSATASVVEDGRWSPASVEILPDDRSMWWPDNAELSGARAAAFGWLDSQQTSDGRWSEDYGVTALVSFAMLNGGRDSDHPVVAKAMAAVLAEAKEDGSFSEGTYVHYYTSTAVMALSAGGDPSDETLVRDGVDMLVREQCDGDEEGFEEWWRGGIGYGGDGRPDMSNTQFALMALAAAEEAYPSIDVPQTTWQQALKFLHRCQNLPEVNDLEWDNDPADPNFGDGGFIYFPGRSNVGDFISYGSVTAAGLWSMMAAGETTDDPASAAALSWLGDNFRAGENPAFGDSAYYYYVWALARALRSAGTPAIQAPDGTLLTWAVDLADELLDRQSMDGSWVNEGSSAYWEGDPVVATCFALLGIEALMPSEGATLRISAPDGIVRVTDPEGRRDAEIPGWSQEPDGDVVLDDTSQGPFSVQVDGADTVEISSQVEGRVRMTKEVGLAPGGGSMTLDVAPLLGPASLVVAQVGALPVTPTGSSTPGARVMMAVMAVVVLAAVASIIVRRGARG